MKLLTYALIALLAVTASAAAMKFSDREKVAKAVETIAMADALAAGTPTTITCRVGMAGVGGPGGPRPVQPEIVLISGQAAFTNLLSAMTTKLNNDKTTAAAYLSSIGVTND